MLRTNCQWHFIIRIMTNPILQEPGANVRPTLGPIGTPCGNRVWVSDASYKSTTDKLLYDIGQGS
jgi:hypothetical protein